MHRRKRKKHLRMVYIKTAFKTQNPTILTSFDNCFEHQKRKKKTEVILGVISFKFKYPEIEPTPSRIYVISTNKCELNFEYHIFKLKL